VSIKKIWVEPSYLKQQAARGFRIQKPAVCCEQQEQKLAAHVAAIEKRLRDRRQRELCLRFAAGVAAKKLAHASVVKS
jgi:hypothetical protein